MATARENVASAENCYENRGNGAAVACSHDGSLNSDAWAGQMLFFAR